ncbi:protein phosphatase 1 regulatory subunit 35 [Erinaceus europaeus]|uniref:Protein phosphatase 1 regulatory subunit 35 n=1 Tax=Erinaceus europaeus TaxID=9365 RepID=A0ABM3VYI1_ERIEU|nr:protein phosphatase 1 regulatory subunit 35 [Erinaceus europaeus]
MLGRGDSAMGKAEGEEAVEAPGPPPEPRAPVPGAPVPEPGLDLSLSPSPQPESPERPSSGASRRKGRADRRGGARKGRQVRFRLAPPSPGRPEPSPAAPGPTEPPAALAVPAQRSSLALGLELQAARAAAAGGQFDAARAVQEQLRKSFQTRCGLEDSVAEGLNVPRSRRLFRDLVSLQVPQEEVLSAALRDKLALLPPQARPPPPKEPPGPGPEMTMLCDPETLLYESPHLALDGLPPLRLQLRPRPSEDTFLMHRILRRWEA